MGRRREGLVAVETEEMALLDLGPAVAALQKPRRLSFEEENKSSHGKTYLIS